MISLDKLPARKEKLLNFYEKLLKSSEEFLSEEADRGNKRNKISNAVVMIV